MLKVALATLLVVLAVPTLGHAAISAGCLPTPLPATPVPPVFPFNITRFDGATARMDIWRHTCLDNTGSVVLVRATPTSTSVVPFICSSSFSIVQGATQYDSTLLLSPTGFSTLCGNLLVPVTTILQARTGPPVPFNDTQAFTYFYEGGSTLLKIEIPAAPAPPLPVTLAGAAILPGSRAVQVGTTATAFATMLATGPGTATGCTIAPTNAPAGTAFTYQQTNAANVPIGQPNTPATIPGGSGQSFVISLTPSAPFAATDLNFAFDCDNTTPVAVLPGVNTLLLTSTSSPGPDIVALAATVTNDGIANIPGASGTGFFSVATVNVGASAPITATVDTGSATLPVVLTICQTNPTTGACINPATPSSSATVQIDANQTPTFAILVRGTGNVAFNPGVNRAFVRFKTAGGATVGATSVAIRTQ